jgi:hypothetical protein
MFSLGIRALLDDLASALGPERLVLAYLNDIYILSNDPSPELTLRSMGRTMRYSLQARMSEL